MFFLPLSLAPPYFPQWIVVLAESPTDSPLTPYTHTYTNSHKLTPHCAFTSPLSQHLSEFRGSHSQKQEDAYPL